MSDTTNTNKNVFNASLVDLEGLRAFWVAAKTYVETYVSTLVGAEATERSKKDNELAGKIDTNTNEIADIKKTHSDYVTAQANKDSAQDKEIADIKKTHSDYVAAQQELTNGLSNTINNNANAAATALSTHASNSSHISDDERIAWNNAKQEAINVINETLKTYATTSAVTGLIESTVANVNKYTDDKIDEVNDRIDTIVAGGVTFYGVVEELPKPSHGMLIVVGKEFTDNGTTYKEGFEYLYEKVDNESGVWHELGNADINGKLITDLEKKHDDYVAAQADKDSAQDVEIAGIKTTHSEYVAAQADKDSAQDERLTALENAKTANDERLTALENAKTANDSAHEGFTSSIDAINAKLGTMVLASTDDCAAIVGTTNNQ